MQIDTTMTFINIVTLFSMIINVQWIWHPVRDASLGRKRIHHDVRIPLGMHPI
jgi:hypothetical protein